MDDVIKMGWGEKHWRHTHVDCNFKKWKKKLVMESWRLLGYARRRGFIIQAVAVFRVRSLMRTDRLILLRRSIIQLRVFLQAISKLWSGGLLYAWFLAGKALTQV